MDFYRAAAVGSCICSSGQMCLWQPSKLEQKDSSLQPLTASVFCECLRINQCDFYLFSPPKNPNRQHKNAESSKNDRNFN